MLKNTIEILKFFSCNVIRMLKAILTGFHPQWGIKKSPSGELAKLWQGSINSTEVEVKSLVLPNEFVAASEVLCSEIQSFQPHFVLMFGAAFKEKPIRIERFFINIENSPMGDNTKIPVKDRHIIDGGPAAYESTLPVQDLIEILGNSEIKSIPSFSAGQHTCNSLAYRTIHWLNTNPIPHPIAAGFIHVSFPNSFGIIEDSGWSVSTFEEITKASIILVNETARWYGRTYQNE
jgi:pyroglutamyl-peptidase